ncbi:MAG: formate--tetrahydrofolate ligase [Gammaproteobacteria bacterium]|nr:MAG: formate--tetrahydrofolate ligase [Gammaproteobacteria bacterium]
MTNKQKKYLSDIEIAREANMLPIQNMADKLGIPEEHIITYGKHRAKISRAYLESDRKTNNGKLILVAGITPTKAGEGKTTTSVGLGDGLNKIGKNVAICLREPSLGPCFGMKGGAAGGGQSQVVPMEEINLHFNGDFHAIGAAHNLLSAMIDNHIYWGNELNIDIRKISWGRVMDMNDRALRETTAALGGVFNGFPRSDHFDITVASEVMAIFCLANDLKDLQERLGEIVVAESLDGKDIYARDLKAVGAMTALLKDAIQPNLVQTMEGTPCLIHGGPFANIAHGCNSVIATRTALEHADYVVTEAGFGADLGAEKFFDIKMRQSGLKPDMAIIVATIRALKMHGGVEDNSLSLENVEAVELGFANLKRHVMNTRKFGVPVMVAINSFVGDTEAERACLIKLCEKVGIEIVESNHWAEGSSGSEDLAKAVIKMLDEQPSKFDFLYNSHISLWNKTHTIALELYGADDIIADTKVRAKFANFQKKYGDLPVCIAKTPLSFSTDPLLKGAPSGHVIPIMDLRLSHGARFIVVICGNIMTMPGLPRRPAAENIYVNEQGCIEGLF